MHSDTEEVHLVLTGKGAVDAIRRALNLLSLEAESIPADLVRQIIGDGLLARW